MFYINKYFVIFFLHQVMQADALVLLGAGNVDVPPTWARPEAVVIRCESTLEPGTPEYVAFNKNWVKK